MAFGGLDPGNNPQPMAEINTTPLVDVMLVLLVVFIITAPLLTHAVRIDLPSANAPVSAQERETIALSIDATGAMYWNDEPLDGLEALDARFAQSAGLDPQPELHLRADRSTRYDRIAAVMASAQRAGIAKIGFVTEPHDRTRAPDSAGPR